jgi:hypothetical protein
MGIKYLTPHRPATYKIRPLGKPEKEKSARFPGGLFFLPAALIAFYY